MKQGIIINLLLIATLITLVIGITAPLLTLEKFYIFENQITLISAVEQLYEKKEWLLFTVFGLFSICLPFVKITSLLAILHIPHNSGTILDKILRGIEQIGKWAMLDVFVVALLLVSVKLGALAKVTVHYGVYVFAASVLLTMILSFWISKLAEKRDTKEPTTRTIKTDN
jgi:paraquat-inducible protein A